MALINCPECNREISDKATSCPNCGLPLEKTISIQPPPTSNNNLNLNNMSCPSCKSENTQLIKVMCLAGTSSGSSTGFGVSSDLDVGVGRMRSSSKTALAEKFTPGTDPAEIGGMLIAFGICALILGGILDSSLGTLVIVIGCICLILSFIIIIASNEKKTKDRREAKAKLYEEGCFCHKCGNTWLPFSKSVESSDKILFPTTAGNIREMKKIQCPLCGHGRDVPSDLIPANGIDATCSKCQHFFRIDAHGEIIEATLEKVHNLVIDDQNRLRCPICHKGQRLQPTSLNLNSFRCISCSEEVHFKRVLDKQESIFDMGTAIQAEQQPVITEISVSEKIECPKCFEAIDSNANKCGFCGNPLTVAT